jgi:hypothetical protein
LAHTRDITYYNIGESDKVPNVDLDRFISNADKLDKAGKNYTKLAEDLQEIVADYKGKATLTTKVKENQINKKDIYYTFDGREYKTLKGRDNYEQRLIDKYNKIFESAKEDVKDPQDIEVLRGVVFDALDMLKKVRTFNDVLSFLEDDEIKKKAQKEFPTIDMTPYTARNKEICHIKNIYDIYDPLMGIFEIHAGVLKYLEKKHKENIKARSQGVDGTISLTINIDENKDSEGFTHSELYQKATKASKELRLFYPQLVGFYEKEKQRIK